MQIPTQSLLSAISFSTDPTGTTQVTSKNKKRIAEIQDQSNLLARLDELSMSTGAREIQSLVYQAIRQNITAGNRSGTLKIPTGVGKTRIFANLLVALQKNWLTLVPRVDLYNSTAREFGEVGFRDHEIKFLHGEEGWNVGEKMLSLLTDPSVNWASGRIQCIMTYQALTAMVRKDRVMGDFIRSHFDVIIEDETHRWLGDRTQNATGALKDWDENGSAGCWERIWDWEITDTQENILSPQEISEAEEVLGLSNEPSLKGRYNYKFTATPNLLGKSFTEDGEYLLYSTIDQAVRTGSIILPQYLDMGSAYTKQSELESWKVADIESLAEGDNFVDESGVSIKTRIIEAYITKKQKHGALPAVAFASTIRHAEQIVAHMREQWIRAERVTSALSDISSQEAVRRMDAGELDVIVTVTKVSEGFDYPPLACAMWFAPSLSPAKILQGNGRIMRYTEHKKPGTVLNELGKISLSPNSYIIASSIWYRGSNNWSNSEITLRKWNDESGGIEKWSWGWKSPRIGNFYELLISQGELDRDMLSSDIERILLLDSLVLCEVWEEVLINNIPYIGVSNNAEIKGLKGWILLANAKKQNIEILSGRKKSWFSIQLIPTTFIDWLLKNA